MSIFGRTPGFSAASLGVKEAVAESIASRFGEGEDLDADVDLDDDPLAVAANVDVEFDVEDMEIDAVLDDELLGFEDDEEDDFGAEDEMSSPSSRVDLANQIRFGDLAKKQARMTKRQAKMALRTQRRSMPQSPLAQLVSSAVEGVMGQTDPATFAQQAGSGMASGMAAAPWWQQYVAPSPSPAQASVPSPEAAPTATPEAGSKTLPPTYVADEVEESEVEAEPVEVTAGTLFGATCDVGFVGKQHRSRAKKSAQNAVTRGMQALARVPFAEPSAMVEDPNAKPILYSDGTIVEPVYGEMLPVPCPSCCRIERRAAFGGLGEDCSVCDGYGAVLLPTSDVPSYMSAPSYGIIPLLVPLVGAAATLGAGAFSASKKKQSASIEEKKHAVMQRLMRRKAEKEAKKAEKEAKVSAARKQRVSDEEEIDRMFAEFDSEKVEGFGAIDDWADSVFGEYDAEDLDDEIFGDDDDLDADEESALNESYGIVRVMVPGGWR